MTIHFVTGTSTLCGAPMRPRHGTFQKSNVTCKRCRTKLPTDAAQIAVDSVMRGETDEEFIAASKLRHAPKSPPPFPTLTDDDLREAAKSLIEDGYGSDDGDVDVSPSPNNVERVEGGAWVTVRVFVTVFDEPRLSFPESKR